jgi:phosphoserine phosphatase
MPTELVAFDMDGTLVDAESSWAEVHRHFGETNREALELFQHDRIDDQEFIRRDVALWWRHAPDLTLAELDRILATVPLMPGAAELFHGLHRRGVTTAIVSGGIDRLAHRIAGELGIGHVFANGLKVDRDGRLTGEGIVRVPIKRKGVVLRRLQRLLDVPRERSAAVGNSDIDVALFRECRTGIAFQPADDHVRSRATHVVTARDLAACLPILLEE